jgi:hypothetical protein
VRAAEGRATSVVASCLRGTVLLDGGFYTRKGTNPSATTFVKKLERIGPSSWDVTAVANFNTQLTSIASCGTGAIPWGVMARATRLQAGEQGTSVATCPNGMTVIFGGVIAQDVGTSFHSVARPCSPLRSRVRPRWSALGANASSAQVPGTVTAIAYCR